MAVTSLTILYIAGWGRSGTTLLGKILGQVPGFFYAGELRHIWEEGVQKNWLCECGLPFDSCAIWTSVVTDAFGQPDAVDPRPVLDWLNRYYRTRHLLKLALSSHDYGSGETAIPPALAMLNQLYRGIQKVVKCRVIVDSSKSPSYLYALTQLPSVEVKVIHVVRDPRATAYSWKRRIKKEPSRSGKMGQYSLTHNSAMWLLWNIATGALLSGQSHRTSYLRVRYEDFVANPARELSHILRSITGSPASLPFIDDRTVRVNSGHAISGNPSKFSSGPVILTPDTEWRQRMPRFERFFVTLLTWPMLWKYGYFVGRR